MQPAYKRILLKLSGEVLAGKEGHGINFDTVSDVCKHVKKCSEKNLKKIFLTLKIALKTQKSRLLLRKETSGITAVLFRCIARSSFSFVLL